jgi:macrolide transport system ATP-binding/permease protein
MKVRIPVNPTPLIELSNIRKSYGGDEGEPSVEILHGIDLTIHAGEFVTLVGASGSGTSTLMHILGCLDRPTSGTYRFAGRNISAFSADELAWLRREAFGFVFQGYHLIRALDALHNVQVPAVYAGTPSEVRFERARALLRTSGTGRTRRASSGAAFRRATAASVDCSCAHEWRSRHPCRRTDRRAG